MPLLETLSKVTTASGRAYLSLVRADCFAIGRIGPAARISPTQRALEVLIRAQASDTLLALLEHASLHGQLYALLGLSVLADARVTDLIARYKECTDDVQTQTACLASAQSFQDVAARIEDGTYSKLLQAGRKL